MQCTEYIILCHRVESPYTTGDNTSEGVVYQSVKSVLHIISHSLHMG